ncbi:hypothetical protein ACF0H2_04880 [Serratia marcescens]
MSAIIVSDLIEEHDSFFIANTFLCIWSIKENFGFAKTTGAMQLIGQQFGSRFNRFTLIGAFLDWQAAFEADTGFQQRQLMRTAQVLA